MLLNLIYKTRKRLVHPIRIKKFIRKVISRIFSDKQILKNLELNFVFVDNPQIIKLNKKYLKKSSATDVLCFKYDTLTADIVISLQQVLQNAKIFNTSAKDELLFVIVHGLLHFKGMRDSTERLRQAMYRKANKLISTIKL